MGNPVAWATLKSAHGNAAHVPAALASLASPDPLLRQAAYWQLDNHVVLQGDLYEAAYYVALELLEQLRGDEDAGQFLRYRLLWQIANGGAPHESVVQLAGGMSMPLEKACRDLVAGSIDLFARHAASANAELRRGALDLIVSLDAGDGRIAGMLEDLRKRCSDARVRRDIDEALAELAE